MHSPTTSLETEPSTPLPASLERDRAIAVARERLFGVRSDLYIGRYRVQGRLGVGGMGEVYLAIDEELDRKVALKRVLPHRRGEHGDERARERLRREARALARLSHPNVVQVYEIGDHEPGDDDGFTFLAMEYIDGQTVAEWLALEPRPWPAVLERFLEAGRGLAAAHRAGIVHRDFKPDNVLIGQDGGVRVADFGLALAGDERHEETSPDELDVESRLTATGAVLGTIRYMPLEQLRGDRVDACSDQFAFCVALYESLWSRAPFELRTAQSRLLALEVGRPLEPRGRVPSFVWRAIRRGLAREADQRWPDMDSLLEALSGRRRSRARKRGAVAASAVGLVAALWLERGPTGETASDETRATGMLCEEGDGLDGVWDAPRRRALAARFDRATVEHAPASRDRVLANLDRWAVAWGEERERVCVGERDLRLEPRLARAQGLCLAAGRRQAGTIVDLLLEEGGAAVDPLEGAIDASLVLEEPALCGNEPTVVVVAPPPELEAEAAKLHADTARIQGLRLLGRLEQADALLIPTLARADVLGHGPLIAETFTERAMLAFEHGRIEGGTSLFLTAIDLAEQSRHELLVARLRTLAALFAARDLASAVVAKSHLAAAELAWERARAGPRDLARMAQVRSLVATDEAAAEAELMLALEQLAGTDAPELATMHLALAKVLHRRDLPRAQAQAQLALTAARKVWGPQHPRTKAVELELQALALLP